MASTLIVLLVPIRPNGNLVAVDVNLGVFLIDFHQHCAGFGFDAENNRGQEIGAEQCDEKHGDGPKDPR